jgi:ribosome biogenesis GTPase A
MKKAIERLEELAGAVNLAIEVLDARAPASTRCSYIQRVLPGCRVAIILTKSDIADPATTAEWVAHFDAAGTPAVLFPPRVRNRESFLKELLAVCGSADDPTGGDMHAVVAGLPNVGKSTLINFLIGHRSAKVGAKPGITRGLQLIRISGNFHILDTPGVISPRAVQGANALTLALVGCLQENFFSIEEAVHHLLGIVLVKHPGVLAKHYDIGTEPDDPPLFCEAVAKRRGFLLKGGLLDLERVYPLITRDFATGRISGVSLEHPSDIQN